MADVTLTAAMRTNLLSIQQTESMIGVAQNRLATGKKVNSAIDDPRNFFTAASLNYRAGDLSRRLDGIGLAIKTFEAADKGIKAITKIVESMAAIAKEALDSTSPTQRATLGAQFNTLRLQLIDVAEDSGFNGTNLLAGNTLTVQFNEAGTNNLAQVGVDWTQGGTAAVSIVAADVSGDDAVTDWNAATLASGATAINASIALVNTALSTLRTQAAAFGSSLNIVKTREEFTKEMVANLKAGADNLVLADINEESANLLTLQTRQQLGVQALSLANQSQQSVLRLFS